MFHVTYDFSGKIVVITGAAKGIGYATAKVFANFGATVIMLDASREVLDSCKEIESANCEAYICDVTDVADIKQTVARILGKYTKIDVLFNCAGICRIAPAEEAALEDWETVYNVNVKGVFLMTQEVGKSMIRRGEGGKIINIGSQAGIVAYEENVIYSSSKAAVLSMTKVFALEWAKYNIQVNAVSPTVVATEMAKRMNVGEAGEIMLSKIPAKRFVDPDELAMAVCFLASDSSNMIVGENLVIDGGFTIQ